MNVHISIRCSSDFIGRAKIESASNKPLGAPSTRPASPSHQLLSELDRALNEVDQAAFMRALKSAVVASGGVTKVARGAGFDRSALHKLLSPKKDPRLSTLLGLLASVGLRLAVKPVKRVRRTAGSPISRRRQSNGLPGLHADLEAITQATTAAEVFKTLNQVLDLIRRSGRMYRLPVALESIAFQRRSQVRNALRILRGASQPHQTGHQEVSDEIFVLEAVLKAGEHKLQFLSTR